MTLTFASKDDWKAVKAIYKEAFPKREQKPFFAIKRSVEKGKMRLWIAKEGNEVLGFVLVCIYENLVMVDYLAVSQKIRSKGTGSFIMQNLCALYKEKKIVLLIERLDKSASNSEQRLARRNFYIKNGFTSSELFMSGKGGEMEILNYGGKVTRNEFLSLFKADLGPLFFKLSKVNVY